jgi:hypothetical protein
MGEIVNDGTPPPHYCDEHVAPGRPDKYKLNPGAVWRCDCGRYWQAYDQNVVDYEGEDYGTERRWREVKNAAGDRWKIVEVDPVKYLSDYGWFRATCSVHGRVSKHHRHRERV